MVAHWHLGIELIFPYTIIKTFADNLLLLSLDKYGPKATPMWEVVITTMT